MDKPEVMTREQVAEMLGVCPDTISNWIRKRQFPHKRIGSSTLRFVRSAVLEWMKSNGATGGSRAA
jgi:excisionase family DNA binding protein